MYPSDFGTPDTGPLPVEPTLFLGLEPLLALICLILVAAIAAGMFFAGRWHATKDGTESSDKAPTEIYEVILRYASTARSASSNELKQKAEVLDRKIDEYLGAVIIIGKDLGGLVKALKTAGEGKIEEPAKPEPEPRAQARGCTCGATATHRDCSCGGSRPHPVAAQPVSINQIYIGGIPSTPHEGAVCTDAKPACDAGPPTPAKPDEKPAPKMVKRDMTHQEQIDALDKAVRAFNDYWLNRDKRIEELKAAQQALNRRPSQVELRPSTGSRIWDRSQVR